MNYLAGFLLTVDLLPLLRAAAPARVVNVASLGQHPLDFDDLMITRGYTGTRAYGQSKLAQIMSGFELAGRFFDQTREARANAQAYHAAARAELWRRSLDLVAHPGIG